MVKVFYDEWGEISEKALKELEISQNDNIVFQTTYCCGFKAVNPDHLWKDGRCIVCNIRIEV